MKFPIKDKLNKIEKNILLKQLTSIYNNKRLGAVIKNQKYTKTFNK